MNILSRKAVIIVASVIFLFYNHPAQALVLGHSKARAVKSPASKWSFKRKITIANPAGLVSDAVIQIKFDNKEFDYRKAKADGSDVRFSTTSENINADGLKYWIEQWNVDGITRIWVKVPVLKVKNGNTIYMHYGNANAAAVSNGNATFLFFDDFEDSNYSKKWDNMSIGEVKEQNGQLKLRETDGQDGIINAKFDVTGKMIIRTLYQREAADEHWTRAGVGGWDHWLCFGDHTEVAATGTNYVMIYDSTSLSSLKRAPLVKAANKAITNKWRRAAYWYDGKSLGGMQDVVKVQLPAAKASSKLALRTLDNDDWDNFAYVTVSNYSDPEPRVTLGQQQKTK
jgi:hypothetical protein